MRNSVDEHYVNQRTPANCRTGPINERRCTDWFCCILYLAIVVLVIIFGVICFTSTKISKQEIEQQLKTAEYGKPFLSISQATVEIMIALLSVAALCFILLITTFIFPSLVAYLYIPLLLLIMLLFGAMFIYRYVTGKFPLINNQFGAQTIVIDSYMALGIGIAFLVGFLIVFITILCKRQKFRNIIPVLQMAKVCFWQNCYMFILAVLLSFLSIGILYLNIFLMEISQNLKRQQAYLNHKILIAIIVIELLFTHGFLQSLSDFLFQSIAIHWYFAQKQYGQNYSKCSRNYSTSIALTLTHGGTIIFGSIFAYIPDFFTFWLGTCERSTPKCYSFFCCVHKYSCRQLSRYSHIQTILQGLPFCQATREMYSLRNRTKSILPQIYMMGNFYMTLAKVLVVMIGMLICYILMIEVNDKLFSKLIHFLPPLIITLIGSLEIVTHFMNCTGLIGDTISFMYAADLEMEKTYYGEISPYSCPKSIRQIIQSVKLRDALYDEE